MNRRIHKRTLPVFNLDGQDGVPEVAACGFKAHNLIRMSVLNLPVPAGFVLGTAWCNAIQHDASVVGTLMDVLEENIRFLEHRTGLGFGSGRRPLLVSVRSGAPVSMPGMMDTVANVGLNEESLSGLLRLTGDHRLAWDSYSRLIMAFAETVAGVTIEPFERVLETTLKQHGVQTSRQLDFRALRELSQAFLELYEKVTKQSFPQNPMKQLEAATTAVFASWKSAKAVSYRKLKRISHETGTAVTIQRMVFGNSGGNSGAGVCFTRDPTTGENRLYVDWLPHAQGEDVVSGRRQVTLGEQTPEWLISQLAKISNTIEAAFQDAQEFEFTVENGRLYMLQTRTAQRSAMATVRIAADLVDSGLITPEEGQLRISGIDIEKLGTYRIESETAPIGQAIPASAGVASGPAVFSVSAAQQYGKEGSPAILVCTELVTRDIDGIVIVRGLLSKNGGRTCHAAVVARQLGKVCLVGCKDLIVDNAVKQARLGQTVISEGDSICLDGNTGSIYAGSPKIIRKRPQSLISRVRIWSAPNKKGSPINHSPRLSKRRSTRS